jgi:hypothetical protein
MVSFFYFVKISTLPFTAYMHFLYDISSFHLYFGAYTVYPRGGAQNCARPSPALWLFKGVSIFARPRQAIGS